MEADSKDYFSKTLGSYQEFLRIPNNGRNPIDITNNVTWCLEKLHGLNFNTRVLEIDNIPHILASHLVSENARTILFYLQIDGQPVDTSAWDQSNPYQPVRKRERDGHWEEVEWSDEIDWDDRVFARSASDSAVGPACSVAPRNALANRCVDSRRIPPRRGKDGRGIPDHQ